LAYNRVAPRLHTCIPASAEQIGSRCAAIAEVQEDVFGAIPFSDELFGDLLNGTELTALSELTGSFDDGWRRFAGWSCQCDMRRFR
jgi:hypothetical protein